MHTALKNMANGLCMFDRDQRLVVCNERYGEMYGLDRSRPSPARRCDRILEARVAPEDRRRTREQYIEARLEEIAKRRAL